MGGKGRGQLSRKHVWPRPWPPGCVCCLLQPRTRAPWVPSSRHHRSHSRSACPPPGDEGGLESLGAIASAETWLLPRQGAASTGCPLSSESLLAQALVLMVPVHLGPAELRSAYTPAPDTPSPPPGLLPGGWRSCLQVGRPLPSRQMGREGHAPRPSQ